MQLTEHNPYLAARHEWDERYGTFITRASNWRAVAFLCGTSTILLGAGLLWQSSRSHVTPFVVLVDNLSRPVASGLADQVTVNDDRIKRSSICNWIEQLRLVTTDGIAQRKAIDLVYSQIASGTEAQAFVSEFYRSASPFSRARTETVSVEVQSVLPTSDRTYEVDWTETTRDLYGAVKTADRWKGSFTIAINPPGDERLARINPLGVYVTSANWDRVL